MNSSREQGVSSISTDKKIAIGVSLAAAFIFAAAFMPWGEIRATPEVQSPFGDGGPFGGGLFGDMQITLTITGWNGNIAPGGLKLPNWLAVLAAACVAAVSWLRAMEVWTAPSFVPFTFAGYGLLHAGFALVALMGSDQGSVGVGSLLTVVAFVAMLVVLVRQLRRPAPANNAPPL